MNSLLRPLSFSLVSVPILLACPAGAQDLTVAQVIQGATAQVEVSGGPAFGVAALLLGAGPGIGPCLGPGGSACLGLIPPYELLAHLPCDAGGSATWSTPLTSAIDPVPISLQGVLIDGAGALSVTPAVHTAIEPISALDDEFNGAALDPSWNLLHPELVDLVLTGTSLSLTPNAFGVPDMWFNEGEGPLLWRPLTGYFTVTTRAHVTGATDLSSPPPTGFRLGGLLVRSGLPGGTFEHDWAHIATGSGGGGTPTGVERKETHDSVSTWSILPTASTDLELRLRRRGASIQLSWREPGASEWIELADFDFPELPGTVQVGPMAYSFSGPPNVTARFDWVHYGL